MKQCKLCLIELTVDNSSKDGSLKCRPCVARYLREYRAANPEKVKAAKAWVENNKERAKASRSAWSHANKPQRVSYNLAYYSIHKDRIKAQVKAWAQANTEKCRLIRKKWQKANPGKTYRKLHPEKVRAYQRKWRLVNPAKHLAHVHNRRARKALAGGTITAEQWVEVQDTFGHACAYCLRADVKLTMDHVTALASGGTNSCENIVPSCGPCNSKKGARGILTML